jgi:uncharacterized protein (DUF4415 family)
MRSNYNFSKAKKRGPVIPEPALDREKVKISIRIDQDVLERFFELADKSGGKVGYQSLINSALRGYVEGKAPQIEDTLRRIIREELSGAA